MELVFLGGGMVSREERRRYVKAAEYYDSELRNYEHHLGFQLTNLSGRKVLDIGGTMEGFFAQAARESGIDLTTLTANNPYYVRGGANVKGMAQELPFQDGTFDLAFSLGMLPYLPQCASEYLGTFQESIRILKKGGKAVLFPVVPEIWRCGFFWDAAWGIAGQARLSLQPVDFSDWSFQPTNEKGDLVQLLRVVLEK
jgi:SAM-dependent methyltransferase